MNISRRTVPCWAENNLDRFSQTYGNRPLPDRCHLIAWRRSDHQNHKHVVAALNMIALAVTRPKYPKTIERFLF